MDKNTTQTVSKGRIVFYRSDLMIEDGTEEAPSIVVKVHTNDVVDLSVFRGNTMELRMSVHFSDDPKEAGWRWPPRV